MPPVLDQVKLLLTLLPTDLDRFAALTSGQVLIYIVMCVILITCWAAQTVSENVYVHLDKGVGYLCLSVNGCQQLSVCCSGRIFATAEILVLVSIFVCPMGFLRKCCIA